MADIPGPEKPPSQHNSRPNYHGGRGGGGHEGGRGGRGRGGGGHRGGGDQADRIMDDDGSGRRKKPELEHYKPGAFSSTRKPEYESGGSGGGNPRYDNDGRYDTNRKSSGDQHYGPRGGGGRGGGQGRNKPQTMGQKEGDNRPASQEVASTASDEHRYRSGGTNRRKNKKPEQPHYSVKKATGGEAKSPDEAAADIGEKESQPVVSAKPPQPSRPTPGGDDAKSEGGGSNTGTAKRKKRQQRLSADKQTPPPTQSAGQEGHANNNKGAHNNAGDDRHHQQHHGGHRQNGYTENYGSHHPQQHDSGDFHHQSHHQEGRGVGRYSGHQRGGGGRRSRGPTPPGSAKSSRRSSPVGNRPDHDRGYHHHQQQPRYHHDESARSSVERGGNFHDRRSSSTGSSSAQRPHSPSRRGGGGPAAIGPRHQRGGGGGGGQHGAPSSYGGPRNSDTSNWRYDREGSHEDYYSLPYDHQPSYDRWNNDHRGGRGGGGKAQVPKANNMPPRFQRVQQQQQQQQHQQLSHQHSYDDSLEVDQQHQPFRRRSSGRRSIGEPEGTRSWRRHSNPSSSIGNNLVFSAAQENGPQPDDGELAIESTNTSAVDGGAAVVEKPEEFARVKDWSEEVEEEEERNEALAAVAPPSSSTTQRAPHERGGIIRLPPSHPKPDVASWRNNSNDHHKDSSNPAWRNVPHHNDDVAAFHRGGNGPPPHGFQQGHHGGPYNASGGGGGHWQNNPNGNRPRPHLFDPNEPAKSMPPGAPIRFAHPPPMHYRPPFPDMHQPPPPARHPHSLVPPEPPRVPPAIETILLTNMGLLNILKAGGPALLADKWDTEVAELRRNALSAFKTLLETHLLFCAKHDVEFEIWKICFYQLVEALKMLLPNDQIHKNIVNLIDEGISFYEAMLETLDRTFKIGLDTYYDVLEPRSNDKNVRCVLISAQKCLLCLGDLARYKEQIKDTANYGTARQYYQKACNIDTRNGRPFNQLAILANCTKRKFEAVYYNMRCLQTSSPIPSSQEFLTCIFEEVSRKWEASEKKRLEEREVKRRQMNKDKEEEISSAAVRGTKLRKEIWIRPEGGRRLHRTTSARDEEESLELKEDTELKELPTSELNRRFNNSFLYLIGKLFTNINMDTFSAAADLLLKEFRILVSRTPLPIDAKRLVQIMALNMFIIEHTKMKGRESEQYRTVAQTSALQLAFEMFGVLVERCNVLLARSFSPQLTSGSTSSSSSSPLKGIFEEVDLPTLLSAVKVWCDWIIGNKEIWYPVVCTEPFKQLAQLATHLEKLKPLVSPTLNTFQKGGEITLLPSNHEYEMIKLEEDGLLCGFNPWFRGLDWSRDRRYAPRSYPTMLVQDVRRLEAIQMCVLYLEGHEPPIITWCSQDNTHHFVNGDHSSTASSTLSTDRKESADEISRLLETGLDILDESYSDDEDDNVDNKKVSTPTNVEEPSTVEKDDIRRLKHRKDELERKKKLEEDSRKVRNSILSEHVSVLLEICPKVIVPDTNCFVDHLSEMGRLSSVGSFHLRVPLVVLNELDGLAKGISRNKVYQNKYSSPDHAAMVAENAKRALTWLKDKPSNTKCVTSRGNEVPSFVATTEADPIGSGDVNKNNDDLILDVCLSLSSSSSAAATASSSATSGTLRVVRRDVVLLTNDRNLRLKAHTTDIPVSSMSDFIRWAFPDK